MRIMKRNSIIFILVLSIVFSTLVSAGQSQANKFNNLIELRIDSIIMLIENHYGYIDTTNEICYTILNRSDDTISFNTNSCPSYNLYLLEVGNKVHSYNTRIRCSFNSIDWYIIQPKSSISLIDEAFSNFYYPDTNRLPISFKIPVVIGKHFGASQEVDSQFNFTVSPWGAQKEYLKFKGDIIISSRREVLLSWRQKRRIRRTKRKLERKIRKG